LVWYAQVWALVHFLNEGNNTAYHDDFNRMLRDAANGTLNRTGSRFQNLSASTDRTGSLFERYFDASAAELDPAYQRFIARVIAPGGQNAIVAGVSPL
ncbi:MAG: hypothetical protein AAFY46_17290, partial [Planctomycetota bacterium]